ncbi:MAG: TonB family protein [Bacteroidales bacterium]|nr:TonB family protein [Bacteroidales bacterium]
MLIRTESFKSLHLNAFFYSGVLLTILVTFNLSSIFAQEMHAETALPSYPGGNMALKEFIAANLHYPEEAQKSGISGIVLVNFKINHEGKMENIRIMRGISPECDAEALRVTKLITGWKPGLRMGKPVSMTVNLPVDFRSDKKTRPTVVSGTVTDKSQDMPVEGVLVIIKGTNMGTVTNAEGRYRLDVPPESQYLEFVARGYLPKDEPIGEHSTVNVELDSEYVTIDFRE